MSLLEWGLLRVDNIPIRIHFTINVKSHDLVHSPPAITSAIPKHILCIFIMTIAWSPVNVELYHTSL